MRNGRSDQVIAGLIEKGFIQPCVMTYRECHYIGLSKASFENLVFLFNGYSF